MRVIKVLGLFFVTMSLIGAVVYAQTNPQLDKSKVTKNLVSLTSYSNTVSNLKAPQLSLPDWYQAQLAAEQKAAQTAPYLPNKPGQRISVTYSLVTKGNTRSNMAEFAAQANQTLNDARGWAQLNIAFIRVPSGGSFNLVLSQASQVPTFSSACSAEWSCRVGSSVIINDDRWSGATLTWNNAGGNIRDYRHMVINHEVGHWLGHGHASCPAAGSYAPVMQQQSISLQGCRFNPWPLASELTAPILGR